jgi:type IV pilus assembly protein PilA
VDINGGHLAHRFFLIIYYKSTPHAQFFWRYSKMRTELQVKFIQHLNQKKDHNGFTLVELLVVIIIIGILAAIALPNFLSQSAKAKQSEAKQNIGLINTTQNSFRAQNSTFADNFNVLALGNVNDTVSPGVGTTTNYSYSMFGATETATVIASPKDGALKGYSGGLTRYNNAGNQSVIGLVVCEMVISGVVATIPNMTNATQSPTCLADTTQKTLSL